MSHARVLPYGDADERAAAAAEVAAHLRGGGVVAYPTETVYGLGCLLRAAPLATLAALKAREEAGRRKPFLLLLRDRRQAEALRWTREAAALADRFWPGALTLALEAERAFPPEVVSDDGAVAVRVSPHPAVAALLQAAGEPVTSTSANLPGVPAARTAAEAARLARGLPHGSLLVLDGGALPASPPSTIVECGRHGARLLRPGALPLEVLREVVPIDG